jgi:hypothetical protein
VARTVAVLPAGARITDCISLGVIAKSFPPATVRSVLAASGRASRRERDLPAHVVMYYVIALALYMQASYREVLRCLLEGLQWLLDPSASLKVAGKSGISQARTRLGWEALRQLHDGVVRPIAVTATKGAWYRQWRLVSLDGSTLDVANEAANAAAFGRPGSSRGDSAYPQIRFVSLVENGTHVLFASHMAGCTTGEITLARAVLAGLRPGMLCLADRQFFGFALWQQARGTGAQLLWRIKKNTRLPCDKRLPDGSSLSPLYACERDRRHQTNAVPVRVIEYRLEGVVEAGAQGADSRFIVTNLPGLPKALCEKVYCGRGQAENLIKAHKLHLASGRTACSKATANQFRLLVHTGAYWLLLTLRGLAPRLSFWRDAQFDTIRLCLIKVAARVTEIAAIIKRALPTVFPYRAGFTALIGRVVKLPP